MITLLGLLFIGCGDKESDDTAKAEDTSAPVESEDTSSESGEETGGEDSGEESSSEE